MLAIPGRVPVPHRLVRVAMTKDMAVEMTVREAIVMVDVLMNQIGREKQLLVAENLVGRAIGDQPV